MAFRTLIDVGVLQAALGAGKLAVLDCRFDLANPAGGRQAYRDGHIPGAHYADLNQDLSSPVTAASGRHPLPDPQTFAATLENWGIGEATQVVAYDDASGSFAARLWWLLRWVGHGSVAVLDGGLKAWVAAGGRLDTSGTDSPAAPGVRFVPRIDLNAVVSTAQMIELMKDPRRLLLDARAAERYAGAVEPIDPVGGHIPGAVNHPLSLNLTPENHFLPPDELRRRWTARLNGTAPGDVVAMCGSGVTACHNLLSLEVAGLGGAKLYAGSWSEWIRDPRRPIARGDRP